MENSDYQLWTWMLDKQAHARFHVGICLGDQGDPCRIRLEWLGCSAEFEPVRTCYDAREGGGWFICSRCGAFLADGAVTNATNAIHPRFCPNCGARVTN
jgi:hypothetical protein